MVAQKTCSCSGYSSIRICMAKLLTVSDQQTTDLFTLIWIVTFCDKAKKQLGEAVRISMGLLYAYFVTSGKYIDTEYNICGLNHFQNQRISTETICGHYCELAGNTA